MQIFILLACVFLGPQSALTWAEPLHQEPLYGHNHEATQRLEDERMLSVLRKYRERNISVEVFYHVSSWQPFWKEVISEQLHMLDGRVLVRARRADTPHEHTPHEHNPRGHSWMYAPSRSANTVANLATKINIVLHGSEEQVAMIRQAVESSGVSFLSKVSFSQSRSIKRLMYRNADPEQKKLIRSETERDGATEGEYATISAAHTHCKRLVREGGNGVVLYMHSKGGCCRKGDAPQSDWRDMMDSVNIEFASVCLRALYDGYSACGADYQDMHFSGNFWWASCNHVAMLPALWDPIDNAYEAEFFIFNVSAVWQQRGPFAEECAFRPFHCQVNHYHERCPRQKYVYVLAHLLETENLPFVGYNGLKPATFEAPKRVWKGKPCLSVQTPGADMARATPYFGVSTP